MKTQKIHFPKETSNGFYSVLKNRVNEYAHHEENKVSYSPAAKTIFLSASFALVFANIFIQQSVSGIIVCYILLGALMATIMLNVIHDSVHNALFRNPRWNNLCMFWLDVFGSDSHIWKRRHVTFHHSYTNISGYDYDIPVSGIVRVLPSSPFMKYHRLQKYYMPVMYLFFTLNWLLHRDFTDALQFADEFKISNARKIKLVVQKIIYLIVMIVLPWYAGSIHFIFYITGFLLMHFAASMISILSLATAHANDDVAFPEADENGMLPDSWALHQFHTTQDFGTHNPLVNAFMGGFNFHIAHHLFPNFQHRHYPRITEIVKQTAAEFGVVYKHKSLYSALVSHFRLLIKNSHQPIEIDM